jgi:hypothetical protein
MLLQQDSVLFRCFLLNFDPLAYVVRAYNLLKGLLGML